MTALETVYVRDRLEWRRWLSENHAAAKVAWLLFYKKGTGEPSIAYGDALDEVLCWGWIDSLVRRIDEARYARKFTPRVDAAKWSAVNRARLRRLLAAGEMREQGLAVVAPEVLAALDDAGRPVPKRPLPEMPNELAEALRQNAAAQRTFESLPPSERRHYLAWIGGAARSETRQKRTAEAVALFAQGKRLGLK